MTPLRVLVISIILMWIDIAALVWFLITKDWMWAVFTTLVVILMRATISSAKRDLDDQHREQQ